jgi:hypothetical protein
MPSGIRFTSILIIILLFSLTANGQYRKQVRFWEGFRITPRAGANFFYGDLVDQSRTSYSLGVVAERELSTYLSGRLQLMSGNMKGKQLYGESDLVYAHFSNFYIDANMGASFRPLDLALGYFKQRSFNPYLFAQFGIIQYNTTEWYGPAGLNPDEEWRKKNGISPTLSTGLGLSYWLMPRISINLEANGTYVFGDEVDGHKDWVGGSGTIYQTAANDYYYTLTAGVSFLINDSKWKNEPKYNRKSYLKTRSSYKRSTNKKYKPPKRNKR